MKVQTVKEFNQTQKSLFKQKLKIIRLNQKSKKPSLFSKSLYLTNFLHMYKIKKVPDSTKYLSHSALNVPKNINLIDSQKSANKIIKNIKFRNQDRYDVSNSIKNLKNNNSTNPNSCKNRSDINEQYSIYEDNIKLKTKINKLKIELFFAKNLNKKKDEEIKELYQYLEDAKFFLKKQKSNYYLKKIDIEKKIMILKDSFENIFSKLREKSEENNSLLKQIKNIDIENITYENEEYLNILKDKSKILESKNKINLELQKKVDKSFWKREKFISNDAFLEKLKFNCNKKYTIIEQLNKQAYILMKKVDEIKSQKNQIMRRNYTIKNENLKLLGDKKDLEEYLMKKAEIEKKISVYKKKSEDLVFKVNDNERYIKSFLNSQKSTEKDKISDFEYIPHLEPNPEENKEKQVYLYESLIQDSKKKQKKLIKIINDIIENTSSNATNNNINNDINNNINNNSKIFNEDINYNYDFNEISIEDKDAKMKEFQFLLNLMFYIKNITKEKITNILLNYKTESFYIGNLNEKDNFIKELTVEILRTINNKKDINNLTEILLYLFQTKYNNNKILFLDKVVDDIYVLDNLNKLPFIKEKENELFLKLENIYLDKINSLTEKMNEIKQEKILYEKLKSIFIEEELYNENHEEKVKIFQFFIYILKKRETTSNQSYSLVELSVKDILEFLYDISSKDDEEKIQYDDFIKALKNMLEEKKKNFDEIFGKDEFINISKFTDILNKNNFRIEDENFDLNNFLQKLKSDENSDKIDVELLKKDLDNI